MPQLFGADQIDLMTKTSMWSEAANLVGDPRESDLFGQFADQEGFKPDTPYNDAQRQAARGRLSYVRDLGRKTLKDAPPKYDKGGQLLNGNGYHELVVHLDPKVPEGQRETGVGGPRRYELSYHHMDKGGKLLAMTAWSGNTPHGLNNAHEALKAQMRRFQSIPR
jgi:hypothetical protein